MITSLHASLFFAVVLHTFPIVHGHIALWHPSEWGFNVTDKTFPYDNRPVAPLINLTFDQWWFHGHLDYPPNPGDYFELPAGQPATAELACNKGATSFFASSEGGDTRQGDNPCPGSDISEFHTTGINDLYGCALAITYESDVTQVKPEDFTVFSVNQTCVWTRFTDFQVPARMPACPPEGCICAWFWIHSPDSGGEQNYMNGFRCNVTGSTSNVALAEPQVPRRCGADPLNGKMQAAPGNCTYGAKNPFYWFQQDDNNMFEGTYSPPSYRDMYNFLDGAQNDIFEDSYPSGLPPPSPNSTVIPSAFLDGASAAATASASPPSYSSASSTPGSSSSSDAASPCTSLPSSSSLMSSSQSPSVSVSISVDTVVSTTVVTVTDPAIPTSSPSSSPSTSTPATSTVYSTVIVIVTDTDAAEPSATSSPSVTTTVYSTVYAYVTASASETDAPGANAANDTDATEYIQLERIIPNGVDDSVPNTTSATPVVSPTAGSTVCKRSSAPGSGTLQRRTAGSMSFFKLPGMGTHRKLKKKSSLWNIF